MAVLIPPRNLKTVHNHKKNNFSIESRVIYITSILDRKTETIQD